MAEVNAGRVMILPLGNYNSATPYHVLDLVYYNGSSWLCRQECTGVTPTDSATAYWQKFGAAVSVATITTAGIVRPDGATVLVAADGTIGIPTAELNKLGIVKPDGTTIVIDANGTLSAQVAGALSALTDVNISQATQGQILQYDVTTQKWKNVSKTWLTELEQMEDVDIDTSTLANGQALIYNATSGKWENANISQYPKLDTVEQIMANTQSGKVADALTIKEINTALTQEISDIESVIGGDYSTERKIGKLGNKDLFERTYSSSGSGTHTATFTIDASLKNITPVMTSGIYSSSNTWYYCFNNGGGIAIMPVWDNSNGLRFYIAGSSSSCNDYSVTIRYTKN